MLAWVVIYRQHLRHSTPIPSSLRTPRLCVGFSGTFFHHSSLSPIFRIFFQVPYPVSPLLATLTKTPGVWGHSSHFGKVCAVTAMRTRISFKFFRFILLRTLLYFFAPSRNSTDLFSIASTLCVKKTTAGAGHILLFNPFRNTCESAHPDLEFGDGGT